MQQDINAIEALRLQLLDNGYTPIRNRDKRTFMKGWPQAVIDEGEIKRWTRRFSRDKGTGLRVEDGLAVIDFDINDKALMTRIVNAIFDVIPELADERFPLLTRSGKGAKEAWFVRTAEIFSRIHSRAWTAPGAVVDDGAHRVEIFGGASPRQFGSFGPHTIADDGSVAVAYRWADRSPADTRKSELPELTKAQFFQIADIVERELAAAGWTPVAKSRAEEDPASACVYDLTDTMVFKRTADGGQVTLAELEDMARTGILGEGGDRYELSPVPWLRSSSQSGGGCLAGATHDGTLFIYDSQESTKHFAITETPAERGTSTETAISKLAEKLAPLGMPSASFEQRQAPRHSQGDIALQFVKTWGAEMRYVEAWGWMRWDGKVWVKDDKGTAYDRAHQLCCENVNGATPTAAKTMTSRAFAWAVVDLVKVHPKIASDTSAWDRDPWLLNTPAGIVDLHTGAMGPHRPEAGLTKITAVAPGGPCPMWLKFLQGATQGDAGLQNHYQRACGYATTGLTDEHALFFMHGNGGNGKTTFVETVAGVMGSYHALAPTDMLMASRNERHPTEIARLAGARLVTATETEEGRHWAEAKLKQLTGGDRIAARFMRMDFFEFQPQFKLMVMGNHKPMLYSVDEAIRRRMNLWPFTASIRKEDKILNLKDLLRTEWAGILQWMIDGCILWAQSGLQAPDSVKDATDDYLNNEDIFGQWLDEETVRKFGAFTPSSKLFARWRQWADDRGETVGSMKKMVERMAGRGFMPKRTESARGFEGIAFGQKEAVSAKTANAEDNVINVSDRLSKAKHDRENPS